MFIAGILLTVGGVLTTAFGMLQNTILFNFFANANDRLARINSEIDFSVSWLFAGPGTIVVIVGIVGIIGGVVLIALKKRK